MNKKWWGIFYIAVLVGLVSVALGFLILELDSFGENILAELAGLSFALALVILLIEGPILTREHKVQEVISIVARRTVHLNEEICTTLVREIGEYLAERLDTTVDLHGDECGDWVAFKPLLQQIFKEAKQVTLNGLPKINIPLSEEDYRSFVNSARSYIERIHRTVGSDWEIIAKAGLLDLVDSLDELELFLSLRVRDEESRFSQLGTIGDELINSIEVGSRIVG